MEQNNDFQTTLTYSAVALFLALTAVFSNSQSAPSLDLSQFQVGEYFYPELSKDLNRVEGLEVYAPNSELGIINNFKVQKKNGVWVIPSQKDYPADAVKKLGEVASSLFGIKRNKFLTSQASEFKKLKVLDPTAEGNESEVEGSGVKVNLLDASGNAFASFIFGKDVEGKNGFKYMRRSDEKRVYQAQVANVELSTKFSDWIETDLLTIAEADMETVKVNDYEVDLQRGQLSDINEITLKKQDKDWLYTGVTDKEETKTEATSKIVAGLDNIVITGVEKKPDDLQTFFRGETEQINRSTFLTSMQPRGFYFVPQGNGIALVSDVGGVEVTTNDGVHYQLWLGRLEVTAAGSDKNVLNTDKKDGDKDEKKDGDAKKSESEGNRYLIIKVDLDESKHPKPQEPDTKGLKEEEAKKRKTDYDLALKSWETKKQAAQEKVDKLNRRFAEWYYKISNEDFLKIRAKREDLVQPKAADPEPTAPNENPFDKEPEGNK